MSAPKADLEGKISRLELMCAVLVNERFGIGENAPLNRVDDGYGALRERVKADGRAIFAEQATPQTEFRGRPVSIHNQAGRMQDFGGAAT